MSEQSYFLPSDKTVPWIPCPREEREKERKRELGALPMKKYLCETVGLVIAGASFFDPYYKFIYK